MEHKVKERSMKEYRQVVNESSLSRMRQHMMEHDTAMITAFRGYIKGEDGEQVTVIRKQNLKRNSQLKAQLSKKYNITVVQGKYIEDYGTNDAKEVGEVTFFVVDQDDTGNLERDITQAGIDWYQDSVLFVEKGAKNGRLIGTNDSDFPGYKKVIKVGNPIFGKSGEFMTKMRGRPFVFEEVVITEHKAQKLSRMGEWARSVFINSDWKEVGDEEPIIDYKKEYNDRFKDWS